MGGQLDDDSKNPIRRVCFALNAENLQRTVSSIMLCARTRTVFFAKSLGYNSTLAIWRIFSWPRSSQ
eukprot:12428642-Karenia_brevis.AAC.1